MKPISECPHCHMRVVLMPEGICPSCRKDSAGNLTVEPVRKQMNPLELPVGLLKISIIWTGLVSCLVTMAWVITVQDQLDRIQEALGHNAYEAGREQFYVLLAKTVLTVTLTVALMAFLTRKVAQARNWARYTVAVLLLVGIVLPLLTGQLRAVSAATNQFGPWLILIALISPALQTAAVLLLFFGPAEKQFRRESGQSIERHGSTEPMGRAC